MFARIICGSALAFLLGVGSVACASDKDDAQAAILKLANTTNYSWTVAVEGGRGNQQPVTYKTEKDGYTTFTVAGQEGDSSDVVMKGGKAVVKQADGWKTTADLQKAADDAGGFSPELIVLIRISNLNPPAAQAKSLIDNVHDVKKAEDGYMADLTEAMAKDLLTFKLPAGSATDFPAMIVKNAKGTLKLWTKDGVVSKMEIHLTGSRSFNGQDTEVNQITTTTVKDIGTTKVTVPDEAKKKLGEGAVEAATAPAAKP